jgi:heterotetrameric sarcosine oxidase gamma subunit
MPVSAVEPKFDTDQALLAPMPGGFTLKRLPARLFEISAFRGEGETLKAALDLPSQGQFRESYGLNVIAFRPDCWIALQTASENAQGISQLLAKIDASKAATIDQSHGKLVFSLYGKNARALLMRGCRLDLRDASFPSGSTATTLIGQITASILCDVPGTEYRLLVGSSFASSLVDWLRRMAGHLAD